MINVNEETKTIQLHGDFNEETSQIMISALLDLDLKPNSDPIKLYVDSYGGDVHSLLAIHDVIQGIKTPVDTIGVGKCMSAGAFLLMSGTGIRKAYKHTRIMIHGLQGDYPYQSLVDNDIWFVESRELNNLIQNLTVKHTGQDMGKVIKDLERDLFMSAQEALEYGIIDEII